MSLRSQAATDAAAIIAETDGFGVSATVTDPDGTSASVAALSQDIWEALDPETGVSVTARQASATFALSALTAAGLEVPKGTTDETSKPWRVSFADITGASHEFLVTEARPDAEAGLVVCFLGAYQPL